MCRLARMKPAQHYDITQSYSCRNTDGRHVYEWADKEQFPQHLLELKRDQRPVRVCWSSAHPPSSELLPLSIMSTERRGASASNVSSRSSRTRCAGRHTTPHCLS